MFFKTRFYKQLDTKTLVFTSDTKISVCESDHKNFIENTFKNKVTKVAKAGDIVCESITFEVGFPKELEAYLENVISHNGEQYAVILGERSYVFAKNAKALIFGLSTIRHLKTSGELCPCVIYDYPLCPQRGYRVYLPGPERINEFKECVDFLAYYKYNSMILEIGGAMEYQRHPKINEKWVEFCEPIISGKVTPSQLHAPYPYRKNSIHSENGDGLYLSKEACKELAAYCKERGIEIIPECPTLSHSDYILFAYPEFAERQDDKIPDTYCPSSDVYKVVFDILDEVIEVFEPRAINIGHDEFYSMCLCDKCKNLDPVDLYAGDVNKIKNYLLSKGVATYMWGEKFLKAISPSGRKYGAWYDPKNYGDVVFNVPNFFDTVHKMPKDVTYLNWYWSFGKHLDRVYHDNGYKMLFGNFNALSCDFFSERVGWGSMGGFVSNWGSFEDEYMQRNCQYFNLISTAYALFCDDYDDDMKNVITERTFEENYRRNYQSLKNPITVTHTTNMLIPYYEYWCGNLIDDEKYLMGHYVVTYEDGTTAKLPVKYGKNITNMYLVNRKDSDDIDPDACAGKAYFEISGSAMPKHVGGKLYCECKYENPYPDKKIMSFEYIPEESKKEFTVEVLEYKL